MIEATGGSPSDKYQSPVERVSVAEAVRDLPHLLDRISRQRICVELEQNNQVIARLSPVQPRRSVSVGELNRIFAELPKLGDELESFATDLDGIRRELPAETDPWD